MALIQLAAIPVPDNKIDDWSDWAYEATNGPNPSATNNQQRLWLEQKMHEWFRDLIKEGRRRRLKAEADATLASEMAAIVLGE